MIETWEIDVLPETKTEVRKQLPPQERVAMWRAVDKLREFGPHLPFPHASAVRGTEGAGLRELRPRAGRSPWRAIYARRDRTMVVAACGPEAQHDPRGFRRTVAAAAARLAERDAKQENPS
jgi:hypothetical protein